MSVEALTGEFECATMRRCRASVKTMRWLAPELVVQVAFVEWTDYARSTRVSGARPASNGGRGPCRRATAHSGQRTSRPCHRSRVAYQVFSMSTRTLHRALAACGETFGSMLIQARVDLAVRMLESPLFDRVTTAEIGRRAGCSDASPFVKVLRRHTGHTPLRVRRARRG